MNKPTCDQCGKSLSKISHRDRHRHTTHPNAPALYKCPVIGCDCGFAFPHELKMHDQVVHCNDFKCGVCGHECTRKWHWIAHYMAIHATYDEKVAHSLPPQPPGENYLFKIYLLINISEHYYKIGWTNNTITAKLTNIKSQFCRPMVYIKSWNLSEKFTEHLAEMLENEIHDHMRELGFKNLDGTREYFYFRNREVEEKLIQYFIETIVEQHEQKNFVAHVPPVEREKQKRDNMENPIESSREKSKKLRGNYIYFFSNKKDVGKIGQTAQTPTYRLSVQNCVSQYGKFDLLAQWLLGDEYNAETKRKSVEDRIIYEMGQRFPRIKGKREYFNILPSENAEAIAIIDKIINSL